MLRASNYCCNCRYSLLFDNQGIGVKAVATKQWTAGLATKEATAVEEPMREELGMTQLMQDPDALTTGMNWYRIRSCSIQSCTHSSATEKLGMMQLMQGPDAITTGKNWFRWDWA